MNVIFHFEFDAVAIVIFATFEFLVSVLLDELFQGPFFLSSPSVLAAFYYYWFIWKLVVCYKFTNTAFGYVDPFAVVGEIPKFTKVLCISLKSPGSFCA